MDWIPKSIVRLGVRECPKKMCDTVFCSVRSDFQVELHDTRLEAWGTGRIGLVWLCSTGLTRLGSTGLAQPRDANVSFSVVRGATLSNVRLNSWPCLRGHAIWLMTWNKDYCYCCSTVLLLALSITIHAYIKTPY